MTLNISLLIGTFLVFANGFGKPNNIIFIVSDDLKADALGCYGNRIAYTPNLDKLAEEGVVFQSAYCQGTWCAPSRASFMRGMYQGKKEEVTWGEHFQKNGFNSTRVGKIFHMRVPGDIIAGTDGEDIPECWTSKFNISGKEAHTPGNYSCLNLDQYTTDLKGRQSTKMPYRMFVTVNYVGDGSDQPDFKAAAKSVELLEEFKKEGSRFFLAIGFVRPHYPSVAPVQYFDRYPLQKIKLPSVPNGDWNDMPEAAISKSNSIHFGIDRFPDNQKKMWSAYLATVTFMDEQLGHILKALKNLGLDQNTSVIFTSDHGYLLGEHNFWQKGNLREEVTRVPLIIKSPGIRPATTKSIVELVDLFPTACELAGLKPPVSVEGTSLIPILENPKNQVKDSALSFVREGILLRTNKWAYMKYSDGSEEFYDMIKDPHQFTNLANHFDHLESLKKMRKKFNFRKSVL